MKLERIILIRHAESEKSTENRHGGSGMPLTERGIIETQEIGLWLIDNIILEKDTTRIFAGNVLQAKQTADLLSKFIGISTTLDDRLRNIDLGVLAGLSEEEAMKQYPDAALSLDGWRQGLIPIEQVFIPNAETMNQFHARVKDFLQELFLTEVIHTAIVIGTRSVAVATTNILLGHHQYNESGYKRYIFDPSSISSFKTENFLLCQLEFANKTSHLTIKPSHPDK